MTSFTSATPAVVADSLTNLIEFALLILFAIMLARVVYKKKYIILRFNWNTNDREIGNHVLMRIYKV